MASAVTAPRLQGSAAAPGASCPVVNGIFLDQGLKSVPCTGRRIPNHWAAKEDLPYICIQINFLKISLVPITPLLKNLLQFPPIWLLCGTPGLPCWLSG